MTKKKESLVAVDFFCGGGGMSNGLSRAGIRVLGAMDNDPDCRETYEANHPDSKFMLEDIARADVNILADKLDVQKHDDNMLFVGCSPCQYWSVITGRTDSERKLKAHPSRNLLRHFLRFVKHYRPGYLLIENVKGILKNPKDSGLSELKKFLDAEGYKTDWDILEACRYGVPQTRRRYVLVASRVLPKISLPERSEKETVVKERIGAKANLPKIKAGESPPAKLPLHRSASLSDMNIKRLKLTPEGGLRSHWAKDGLLIPAYQGKPVSFFRENYGRMSWNNPAPTITTKFFALGCGRFGHPEQNRAISLLEGALLQTFPKKYKFKTRSYGATAKLIGNAVPPELAKRIGKALMKQAGGG